MATFSLICAVALVKSESYALGSNSEVLEK